MNRYGVTYGGYQIKQGVYHGIMNTQGLPKAVIAASRTEAFTLLAEAFRGQSPNGLPTQINVTYVGAALPIEPKVGLEY